ncbi:nitroreductase family deazaflavin-dependent oxidoreductase [Alloactinosynnema sp. L-07]|uniref:nitroreductase family deazaflavin-dependent oxidoreductase n=1 Tax=Alloactinosynnema sp. L-07 TaxID=1653480 RepID=UPI0006B5F931|nr:nitroreductase family deazaflavin-dependent oxidoreductase [Alloactinosynnema sp. L-07]
MTDVTDSPTGWVAKHIERYVATDGADGHLFQGHAALLLTTRGRKSGVPRRTPLFYGRAGAAYLLVASNGGSVGHPSWYLNLRAEPSVTVQVLGEVFMATARTAGQDERPELWDIMVKTFGTYATYQRKTEREIPVVVLERG